MTLVAGVDCSTQSTKVHVYDAETGAEVRAGTAPHPDTTEIDPQIWWDAYQQTADGLLDGVSALSVGGQQHGMVVLDDAGAVVRPALLWNDTRSAPAAAALTAELGGPQAWADAIGSVLVASFTITKLRWFAEHEPELAARASSVLLPHDWLTAKLAADPIAVTDRGDASGTGYFSAATGEYRTDLLAKAFGRELSLPRIAAPSEQVGETADGIALAPGTGDNMAAALGLSLQPGDVVVSLGTSGTAFAVAERSSTDASGAVAGFADATGRFLPLVCTLNAARVVSAMANLLGVDLDRFNDLAVSTPDSGGLVLLPYLDGERTPDLPLSRGLLQGLSRANATPATLARATVEGMLCGLADGVDALRGQRVEVRRVLLIGGAAVSPAVQALAPAIFGVPVAVPQAGQYVARGAARQAAWVVQGGGEPPAWPIPALDLPSAPPATEVRKAYAAVRDSATPLLSQTF